MGLGKPKLHTKFEVDRFSRCRKNKGGPQFFWELPYPRATPTFSSVCDFWMGLGKPKLHTKFEVARFRRYGNISKLPPKIWDSPKWINPLLFVQIDLCIGFAAHIIPIQCTTFVALSLQQMVDFGEIPYSLPYFGLTPQMGTDIIETPKRHILG